MVHHFGCWRGSDTIPFEIADTRHHAAYEWIETNQPLFFMLNKLFAYHFPQLYAQYNNVDMLKRFFGAWAAVAINKLKNTGMHAHNDKKDYRNGLCWTVPFGYFTEGDLYLKEINTYLSYTTGDVNCMKSFQLTHKVEPFKGERYSLALFTHHNMFFPYV